MKGKLLTALFGVFLVGTFTARADLITPERSALQPDTSHAGAVTVSQLQERPSFKPPSQHLFGLGLYEEQRFATAGPMGAASDLGSDAEGAQLTALPPAPDSALLAISGLMSLGAIQLSRNIRKIHLGALPEWYHDGAVQVGHSTPLDLDLGFTHAALPVCVFAQPANPIGPVCSDAQWPDAARCAPQFQPTSESPRAPPKHS